MKGTFVRQKQSNNWVPPPIFECGLWQELRKLSIAEQVSQRYFLEVTAMNTFDPWNYRKLSAEAIGGRSDKSGFVSYAEAKAWAKRNCIRTWAQWCRTKRPSSIPSCPWRTYAKSGEWVNWGVFVDTGIVGWQKRTFVNYVEAATWAQESGIRNTLEWRKAQRPQYIPYKPNEIYSRTGEWKGWDVFLHGTQHSKSI